MEEMDQMLLRYQEIRAEIIKWETKLDRYKKKIQEEMVKRHLEQYQNSNFKVIKCVQERSTLTKKNVPPEIWEKYSTRNTCEYLLIKPNPKPKKGT